MLQPAPPSDDDSITTAAAGDDTPDYYRIRDGKDWAIVEVSRRPGSKVMSQNVIEEHFANPDKRHGWFFYANDAEYLGKKRPKAATTEMPNVVAAEEEPVAAPEPEETDWYIEMTGGAIGWAKREPDGPFTKSEAQAKAKRWNKELSAGERGYYKIKYKAFKKKKTASFDEDEDENTTLLFRVKDHGVEAIIKLQKTNGEWHETLHKKVKGDPSALNIGSKSYMSYLTPQDLYSWLNKDYQEVEWMD